MKILIKIIKLFLLPVLNIIKRLSLKTKFLIARNVPNGKPIKQDKNKEIKLTFIESNKISNKSASNLTTKSKAC